MLATHAICDSRPARVQKSGDFYDCTCISGVVHAIPPRLLNKSRGQAVGRGVRRCFVRDGPRVCKISFLLRRLFLGLWSDERGVTKLAQVGKP